MRSFRGVKTCFAVRNVPLCKRIASRVLPVAAVRHHAANMSVAVVQRSSSGSQSTPLLSNSPRRSIHTARRANSVLDLVGRTPVVRLNRLGKDLGQNLFVKLEYQNPLGSVKDRLAVGVIEFGERSGKLKPGMTVVEATSGNTGIALAMVCAVKGYPLVITMAETFSVERRRIMRMLGAKVVVTPAALRGTGMVRKAKELADQHGWYLTRQFENEANAMYHSMTTGPELLQSFSDIRLNAWVTGYGTAGTLQGVGRVLRAASPDTKIFVSEPKGASIMASGKEQERKDDGSPAVSHPEWNPHTIQGWTPDFIPLLGEQAMKLGLVDKFFDIDPSAAALTSRALAREEGIFTGMSGGATVATMLEAAKEMPKGSNICAMVPDTAERYMSTPLFQTIEEDMNEEEQAIMNSTPLGRSEEMFQHSGSPSTQIPGTGRLSPDKK